MKRNSDGKVVSKNSATSKEPNSPRWTDNSFDVPCLDLATNLLGQTLVRKLDDGSELRCRIVETECYMGVQDKACHTFGGRKTERNKPMYMKPGTSYVYFTYGMYHCFNISSQEEGSAVLIRAADPMEGEATMQLHRQAYRKNPSIEKSFKVHELCNGPSKLCMSLAIDRFTCTCQDLAQWPGMWIEEAAKPQEQIVASTRVGIDSVEDEWRLKPLRFYLHGNKSVSKRDRAQEEKIGLT